MERCKVRQSLAPPKPPASVSSVDSEQKRKIEPIRVKQLMQTPNPESGKKRIEPKRIKELYSELSTPSTNRSVYSSHSTGSRVKTSRRTLYEKSVADGKPQQSAKVNTSRRSLIPRINALTEKKKRKANVNPKPVAKTNELVKVKLPLRKSIVPTYQAFREWQCKDASTSVPTAHPQSKVTSKVPHMKEIPLILANEENLSVIDENFDQSITDKENIPPHNQSKQQKVPLGENKEHQFDGLDLHVLEELKNFELDRDFNYLEDDKYSKLESKIDDLKDMLKILIEKSEENTLYMKTIINGLNLSVKPVLNEPKKAYVEFNKTNLISDDKENRHSTGNFGKSKMRKVSNSNESTENFIELENKCNIQSQNGSKFLRQRAKSEIELRTYMKCKMDTNCLMTPDTKVLRAANFNTPNLKRYVSNKVLSNIKNLYAD